MFTMSSTEGNFDSFGLTLDATSTIIVAAVPIVFSVCIISGKNFTEIYRYAGKH